MDQSKVDEIMKKATGPDRYNWAMIWAKRNIYGAQDMVKEDWEAWVERNPRGALTSKELGGQSSETSDKPIGIPYEPGATQKPPMFDIRRPNDGN